MARETFFLQTFCMSEKIRCPINMSIYTVLNTQGVCDGHGLVLSGKIEFRHPQQHADLVAYGTVGAEYPGSAKLTQTVPVGEMTHFMRQDKRQLVFERYVLQEVIRN